MECFEVRQEQEHPWSVSSRGQTLSVYQSEEEARWAALLLAYDRGQSGTQANVVIQPPASSHFPHEAQATQRFTGM
jgi:hypothetical protein